MKTKIAIFWAIAVFPALSNPAKPEVQQELDPAAVAATTCQESARAILESVPSEPQAIEDFVSEAVTKFPRCSCEIVKAVIEKTKAEPKLVGRIVHAAIVAAPEYMRLTAQCAIAVAPDALAEVQSLYAELEGNAGETGKSAKSGKESISGKEGVPAKGGGLEVPQGLGKDADNLMNPVHLPIGVPGTPSPINGPVKVPETTKVDTDLD